MSSSLQAVATGSSRVKMAGPSSSFYALATDSDDPSSSSKKRKIDRACDGCRRRKTKCDGPKMRDNICTNCLQSRKVCTYVETSKPRGPPKAYVVGLEERLEKMEELIQRYWPDSDFSDELGPPVQIGSWKDGDASTRSPSRGAGDAQRDSSSASKPGAPKPSMAGTLFSPSTPLGFSSHLMLSPSLTKRRRPTGKRQASSDDHDHISHDYASDADELVENFDGQTHLSIRGPDTTTTTTNNNRFHGTSSNLRLLEATRKYKNLHAAETGSSDGHSPTPSLGPNSSRRAEYWHPPKWELRYEGIGKPLPENFPDVLAQFPPHDLAENLIDLYFKHINVQLPLLHRPTFERQWRECLHERNAWFASLVVSVFAVASRYSDDVRVLSKKTAKPENEADWTGAGWDFYGLAMSIHSSCRSLLFPATLFEVQGFSLLSMFLRGTQHHALAWHFTSVGIRKAQDVGAHRKTVYSGKPSVVEEQWKRAFWMLLAFDRIGSQSMGRLCSVGEEDYDIDLPLEVDDEYWEPEDSTRAFRQPSNIPSKVSAFVLWIKLTQINIFIMRTVYATNPAKVIMGRPIGKPEQIVSQINAALTEWVESVPEPLRWAGGNTDQVSANLSATLYTSYYLTQMLLYRPFIPAPNASSKFPFPALSICTNAARSSARIVEEQLVRGIWNVPNLIACSIISAGLLLVHVWELKLKDKREGGSKSDQATLESLLHDVDVFIKVLEWTSLRYENVKPALRQIKAALPEHAGTAGFEARQISLDIAYSETTIDAVPVDTDMDHSQELIWDGTPSNTPPSIIHPLHARSGSAYSSGTLRGARSSASIVTTPLSSASLSATSGSFYEQGPYSSDADSPIFNDDRSPYPFIAQTQRFAQDTNSWRSRPRQIPRIASYQRVPHSSPAYTSKAQFLPSHDVEGGYTGDMEEDWPQSKYADEDDDLKSIPYSQMPPQPPISDARSTGLPQGPDRRVLRPPLGWDRQSRYVTEDNKSSYYTWDSQPHRVFHEYSPTTIPPHTS